MAVEKPRSPKNTEDTTGNNLPTKTINLAHNQVLDLSDLTETQIQELKIQYNSGMIDIQKKAAELQVEVGALDAVLRSMNDQAAKATEAGTHATITHTQTSTAGRTEVVIGNTDKAASGKISRSAAGQKDIKLWIIGILAITGIIIAMVIGR